MANPFDAVIQAVDKASGPLREVAKSFGLMGGEAEKAGKKVEHADHPRGFMALTGHVTLLRNHFGRLNESIGEVGHSLTEFLPMIAGLGAAGSLVGLVEMTEHIAEARGELTRTATSIGITADQLQNLNTSAKLMDVPVDRLDRGMQRLGVTIGNAAAGKNKDAAALFAHLGISMKDASGHLRSANDLLPQLAEAFQHTTDASMRARMASVLFGQRMGVDLIPFLIQGKQGLDDLQAAAAKVNYAPTETENAGLESFHRNWVLLGAAVEGFETAIAAKLAPVLAPIVGMFSDWVATNWDWIATGVAGEVGKLGAFLQTIHMQDIVDGFQHFAHVAGEVLNVFGPMNTAIGAAVLVFGSPLLGAVGSAITIFGSLSRVLLSLGSILWANPILAAVGLLALAAYEIWQHWDWVKGKFEALFTWFSGQSAWVQNLIAAIFPIVGVPLLIMEHWEPIKAFFRALWDDVTGIFTSAWAKVGAIIDKIKGAISFLHLGDAVASAGAGMGVDGMPASLPGAASGPLPSPYNPGSPAASTISPPGQGLMHTIIEFINPPAGMRTRTETSGPAAAPEVNMGDSMPAFAG